MGSRSRAVRRVYVHSRFVSFTDATIARLPRAIRPVADRHHELIKFAIVGATTFFIDSVLFYTLKLTVLEPKPVTAKIISGIVAVIASYILNREWSFRDRGGRERHHEALLFFAFSGVGVLLSMAPLWFSSYVLQLRVPDVSLTDENIADFIAAYVLAIPIRPSSPPLPTAGSRRPSRKAWKAAKSPCCGVPPAGIARRAFVSGAADGPWPMSDRLTPRRPRCRKLRDTAGSAPARPAGRCEIPTEPVTPTR
jgi:putative flippase GtrA